MMNNRQNVSSQRDFFFNLSSTQTVTVFQWINTKAHLDLVVLLVVDHRSMKNLLPPHSCLCWHPSYLFKRLLCNSAQRLLSTLSTVIIKPMASAYLKSSNFPERNIWRNGGGWERSFNRELKKVLRSRTIPRK